MCSTPPSKGTGTGNKKQGTNVSYKLTAWNRTMSEESNYQCSDFHEKGNVESELCSVLTPHF